MIMRAAAIVGIGQTAYGKSLPGAAWELAMEAVLAACADAGVNVAEVDGMCRFTAPFETVTEAQLVRGLGIRELSWFTQAAHGGEALGGVVMHAAAAVSAGLASTVVVYRALSQSKGGKRGRVVVTNIYPVSDTRPQLAMNGLAQWEKQIVGCIFGSVNSRADVPMLLNLYKDGLLDLDGMVTRTYPLENINVGYADMHAGRNIRGVLVM